MCVVYQACICLKLVNIKLSTSVCLRHFKIVFLVTLVNVIIFCMHNNLVHRKSTFLKIIKV